MSTKPFPIRLQNIEKSPFANMESVQKALKHHKNNVNIGFTYVSSLKSMGLLPRKDGFYRLGKKYTP